MKKHLRIVLRQINCYLVYSAENMQPSKPAYLCFGMVVFIVIGVNGEHAYGAHQVVSRGSAALEPVHGRLDAVGDRVVDDDGHHPLVEVLQLVGPVNYLEL